MLFNAFKNYIKYLTIKMFCFDNALKHYRVAYYSVLPSLYSTDLYKAKQILSDNFPGSLERKD